MVLFTFLFTVGLTVLIGPIGFLIGFLLFLVALVQSGANKRNKRLIREIRASERRQANRERKPANIKTKPKTEKYSKTENQADLKWLAIMSLFVLVAILVAHYIL